MHYSRPMTTCISKDITIYIGTKFAEKVSLQNVFLRFVG